MVWRLIKLYSTWMFSLMRDCVTLLGIVTTPRCVCHLQAQHVQSLERSSVRSVDFSPPWYKLQKCHYIFLFFPTKIVTSTASTWFKLKGRFQASAEKKHLIYFLSFVRTFSKIFPTMLKPRGPNIVQYKTAIACVYSRQGVSESD